MRGDGEREGTNGVRAREAVVATKAFDRVSRGDREEVARTRRDERGSIEGRDLIGEWG